MTRGGTTRGDRERRLPLVIVGLQAMTSLVVAAGLSLIENWHEGAEPEAALLAGAVTVLPGAWFAWRATAERSPGRLLAHGAARLILTLTSMVLVFMVLEPEPLGFLLTLILMQAMYVVGPLVFATTDTGGADGVDE
jgi:F0F1-type ATP synthase assembly protein I